MSGGRGKATLKDNLHFIKMGFMLDGDVRDPLNLVTSGIGLHQTRFRLFSFFRLFNWEAVCSA